MTSWQVTRQRGERLCSHSSELTWHNVTKKKSRRSRDETDDDKVRRWQKGRAAWATRPKSCGPLVTLGLFLLFLPREAQPSHQWRSNDDISKIYDSATPNPTGSLSGPWFDMATAASTNTTEVVGVLNKITHLACKIKNLGNHTVSWVRHRDTRLLTIGLFTYTPEPRISAIHRSNSEDWVLEIRATSKEDAGFYECQVSTTPIRKHVLHLAVAEPQIVVRGGQELHVKEGSTLNLTCEISGYPKAIHYVTWYKDDKSLHSSERHKISLSANLQVDGKTNVVANAVVDRALSSDTGHYRCSSEAGESSETAVHVITGETPAGLQLNAAKIGSAAPNLKFIIFFALLLASRTVSSH